MLASVANWYWLLMMTTDWRCLLSTFGKYSKKMVGSCLWIVWCLTSEEEACAIFLLLQKISNSEVNQNDCGGWKWLLLGRQVSGLLPGASWPGLGLQLLPLHQRHLLPYPWCKGQGSSLGYAGQDKEEENSINLAEKCQEKTEFLKKKQADSPEDVSVKETVNKVAECGGFKCDQCKSSFKSENGLNIHAGKSHKTVANSSTPGRSWTALWVSLFFPPLGRQQGEGQGGEGGASLSPQSRVQPSSPTHLPYHVLSALQTTCAHTSEDSRTTWRRRSRSRLASKMWLVRLLNENIWNIYIYF